jgi:hypothetical protein
VATPVIHDMLAVVKVVHDILSVTWIHLLTLNNPAAIQLKDVIGWFITAGGIAVATLVAVSGWRKSAATASKSITDRQDIEDERSRSRAIRRVRSNLSGAFVSARVLNKKNDTIEIAPEVLRDIVMEWKRYDRVSDDLHLMLDEVVAANLDATMSYIRMTVEQALESEKRYKKSKAEALASGDQAFMARVRDDIFLHREKQLANIREMGTKARLALDEFNRLHPPPPGLIERDTPDEDPTRLPPSTSVKTDVRGGDDA